MKRLFIFVSLVFVLNGCFKTPTRTGAISEENRINLSSLAIGMSQQQVLDNMGYPYKTEEKVFENKIYEIWYYITEPTLLGQSKLITRNFTPVVFQEGHLIGWGNNFYKHTFDIDDERFKRQEEKRQQYTDDKEEWPASEHRMIAPLNEQKSSATPTTPAAPANTTSTPTSTTAPATALPTSSPSSTSSTSSEVYEPQEETKSTEPQPMFQEKPSCCLKKAEKTNACDKCNSTDTTKADTSKSPTSAKPSTTTTPASTKQGSKATKDDDKTSPCKNRKDTDDGYNFWE